MASDCLPSCPPVLWPKSRTSNLRSLNMHTYSKWPWYITFTGNLIKVQAKLLLYIVQHVFDPFFCNILRRYPDWLYVNLDTVKWLSAFVYHTCIDTLQSAWLTSSTRIEWWIYILNDRHYNWFDWPHQLRQSLLAKWLFPRLVQGPCKRASASVLFKGC